MEHIKFMLPDGVSISQLFSSILGDKDCYRIKSMVIQEYGFEINQPPISTFKAYVQDDLVMISNSKYYDTTRTTKCNSVMTDRLLQSELGYLISPLFDGYSHSTSVSKKYRIVVIKVGEYDFNVSFMFDDLTNPRINLSMCAGTYTYTNVIVPIFFDKETSTISLQQTLLSETELQLVCIFLTTFVKIYNEHTDAVRFPVSCKFDELNAFLSSIVNIHNKIVVDDELVHDSKYHNTLIVLHCSDSSNSTYMTNIKYVFWNIRVTRTAVPFDSNSADMIIDSYPLNTPIIMNEALYGFLLSRNFVSPLISGHGDLVVTDACIDFAHEWVPRVLKPISSSCKF